MRREPKTSALLGAVILATTFGASTATADDGLACKLTRPDGTTQTVPCPPDEKTAEEKKNAENAQIDSYDRFIADAQKVLAQKLKDPDSAKWKDVYIVGNDGQFMGICGEIMAKNSYGAYTGWKRFLGRIQPYLEIAMESGDQVSQLVIGAAYDGLNVAWGGNGRTIFGTLNSGYEALIPYDGYCKHLVSRRRVGAAPARQGADSSAPGTVMIGEFCSATKDCEGLLFCIHGVCGP